MVIPASIQSMLRKAVAAVLALVLVIVLLMAVVIGAFVMLLNASVIGLEPYLGEAGAYGATGTICLLLLGLLFWTLIHGPSREASGRGKGDNPSPVDMVRGLVREHPWGSVSTAFALGIAEIKDPRMKAFMMESGLAYLKTANRSPGAGVPTGVDGEDPEPGRDASNDAA